MCRLPKCFKSPLNEIGFIYSLSEYFVTGIFSLEMANLFYTISKYVADVIFESWRSVDAYSTRILIHIVIYLVKSS
jgi:hypothetical protein